MEGHDNTFPAPTGGAIAREWARSWITRAAALLLLVPFTTALVSADITSGVKALAAGALIVGFARPGWAVVIAATLIPLAPLLQRTSGATIDIASLVAGAIVPGALVRLAPTRDPAVRWPAIIGFGVVIAISLVNQISPMQAALVWLNGLGLAVIAARVARSHPRLGVVAARTLLICAGLLALTSLAEVVRIAARSAAPMATVIETLLTLRVSPVFVDPNAAGSYFALFGVSAACVYFFERRAWRWLLVLAVLGVALWLTGSRTAVASAVLTLAVVWIVVGRPRRPALAAAAILTALTLSYLVFAPPSRQPQAPAAYAAGVRLEMARVAIAMTAQHPILGVGLGNFQEVSRAFISPDLVAAFPPAASGENAHNNFVQILAELGVLGLAGFVAVLIPPLRSGWRALSRHRQPREGAALCAGITAFLITCLAGHPLLIPSVTLVFLLTLGLEHGLTKNP